MLRQGTLLPQWTYSPAWNAGEPRFTFYPPLSWLLGAALQWVLPIGGVPGVFVFLALTLAGLGMYSLARDFTLPPASLIAATVYLAGPYALFTALERSAYAELLAAAWLPWLLRSVLRDRLSVTGISIPFALLWLTNVPAAVMGTYMFATLWVLRLGRELFRNPSTPVKQPDAFKRFRPTGALHLMIYGGLGTALGLALAAFFLLPAAYEQGWVQMTAAIIPNMRVEDNFLFSHTGDPAHDAVLRTASLIAVGLIAATAVALLAARLRETSHVHPAASSPAKETAFRAQHSLPLLTALAGAITFLLTSGSKLLWHDLPELRFLQFPWRLMVVLSLVLTTALALALTGVRLRWAATVALCVVFASAAGLAGNHAFRTGCEVDERPAERLALFTSGHGSPPTDEYTPAGADNDELRTNNPPFWLAGDPEAFAPGTRQSPAALTGDYDTPAPEAQTVSAHAPVALELHLQRPAILILNLRAFRAWRVLRNGLPVAALPRMDGLIAVPLPSGDSHIDVRWQITPDHVAGNALSLAALAALALNVYRSRKLRV